jgi:tetratricopeptide (TPR) repeat protein
MQNSNKIVQIACFVVVTLLSAILISGCNLKNSDKVDILIFQAEKLQHCGNYEAAIELVDKAISLDKSLRELYYYRGILSMELKRFSEAIANFDIVLRKNSDHTSALFNKGVCFFYLERHDSAVALYNMALNTKTRNGVEENIIYNEFTSQLERVDVDSYIIRFYRGLSFYELERYEEALPDLKSAVGHNYEPEISYYCLGFIEMYLGNKNKGCSYFKAGADLQDSLCIEEYKRQCLK